MGQNNILHTIFGQDISNPDELSTVVNSFEQKEVSKNETILTEGEQAHKYYFVETGCLRAFAIDTKGNDITTGFYTSGDIVWEVASLFLHIPAIENIQALEDSIIWQMKYDRFQELFDTIPSFRKGGRTRLVQTIYH